MPFWVDILIPFMKEPAVYLNKDGQNVPVMHTGKSGIYVGMLKLTLAEE